MTLSPSHSTSADRAFPSQPRVDRYFPSAAAEECRTRLVSCVERGEGPAVLIGGPGSGKTMLLEVVVESLRDRFAIASLAGSQLCTRRALLQSVLHALGLPHNDHEEGDLRLALIDHVQNTDACPKGVALLVDEAHALAPRLLEELRVLGNASRRGEPLVRLVMAGTTRLEERLAAPELETLNQRLAARCYLSPMTYDEVAQYIRGHIAATGADPDQLFRGDAAAAVFEAADGVPRLVNQLCDRAIVMAVKAGQTTIGRNEVLAAWADLHQLPAPWHSNEPELPAPEFDVALEEPAVFAPPAEQAEPHLDPPKLHSVQEVEARPESPAKPAAWNADAALQELPAASEAAPPETPRLSVAQEPHHTGSADNTDLFGDDFDEEEVLLDRYASLAVDFPPTAPVVSNQEDDSISTMVARLALTEEGPDKIDEAPHDAEGEAACSTPKLQAAELEVAEQHATNEDVANAEPSAEEELVGLPFPVALPNSESTNETVIAGSQACDEACSKACNEACNASIGEEGNGEHDGEYDEECEGDAQYEAIDIGEDPAVLLIETEAETLEAPLVRRREYRQLFASLRGG